MLAVVVTLFASALATEPAHAASRPPGQFVVRCGYSHTLMDDPIVFPGQPGASHEHDFFGNRSTDASSTLESMLAADTTCRAASDTAGYWTPTVSLGGVVTKPKVMRIYYLGTPGRAVQTFPVGLQMVGGSKLATSAAENPHVRWYCGETLEVKTPKQDAPYDCTPWSQYRFVDGVIAIIDFPNCWDGEGLTPEHVTYPVGGACPSGFPNILPRISERLHTGVMNPLAPDGTMALTLSSGPYYTMHADFWNTWQQARLDQLVHDCLAAHVHCGSIDAEHLRSWTEQFGTARFDLASAAVPFQDGIAVGGFTAYELVPGAFHHRYDAFVRLVDADGSEVWTRQFGTAGIDEVTAVATDGTHVFVAGFTDGRLPHATAAGGNDVFVARLDAAGQIRWVRQVGSRGDDEATGLVVDGENLFVVGTTSGSFTSTRSAGGTDGFLQRWTTSGDLVWTERLGTPRDDTLTGIARLGNHLVVVGSAVSPDGDTDATIRGVTRSGEVEWSPTFSTDGQDAATAVAAGGGEAFVVGTTTGDATTPTAGGLDGFLETLDGHGVSDVKQTFGGAGDDEPSSITLGDAVYVGGSTSGSVFDQPALGEEDGFISRFVRSGVQVWTEQIGTTDYDRAYGLAVTARGAYLVGTTHGAFEGATNAGDRDVFVASVAFT